MVQTFWEIHLFDLSLRVKWEDQYDYYVRMLNVKAMARKLLANKIRPSMPLDNWKSTQTPGRYFKSFNRLFFLFLHHIDVQILKPTIHEFCCQDSLCLPWLLATISGCFKIMNVMKMISCGDLQRKAASFPW